MDIMVATGNPGKLVELNRLLEDCPVQLHSLKELDAPEPEENGLSFVENALIKARAAAAASGMPALADDSGLLVDALGGAPGLYSARFAQIERAMHANPVHNNPVHNNPVHNNPVQDNQVSDDQLNNETLLRRLTNVPSELRGARFHCTCVYLRRADDPAPLVAIAEWPGMIVEQPQGDGGFGYDPLFMPQGLSCTSAQLPPEQKNRVSHRGQAVSALVAQLRREYRWA